MEENDEHASKHDGDDDVHGDVVEDTDDVEPTVDSISSAKVAAAREVHIMFADFFFHWISQPPCFISGILPCSVCLSKEVFPK